MKMYRFLFPFIFTSFNLFSPCRLCKQTRLLNSCKIRLWFTCIGINRTLNSCSNGEFESLQKSISEFDCPHDRISTSQGDSARSKGNKVRITPHLACLLRANFYTVKAFPALLRLLIVCLHLFPIQSHEVVGTDMLACSLVLSLTTIAFFSNYKT